METYNDEFRRKLNRDPDKGFNKLSADGKVLVSSLRTALEDAKQRIIRLRDENDQKDDIIEEERNHRVALEAKMEKYLVDLYQNPSVNLELHQRLPRAKKKGLLFQRDGDEEHDAGSESSDVENKDPSNHSQLNLTDPSLQMDSQIQDGHQTDAVMTSSVIIPQQSAPVSKAEPNRPLPNALMTQTPGAQPASLGNQPQYVAPPYYTPMYQYQYPQQNPILTSSLTSIASSSYMGLPSVTANNNQGGTQESNKILSNGQIADLKQGDVSLEDYAAHPTSNIPPSVPVFQTVGSSAGHQQAFVPPLNLNTPIMSISNGSLSQDRQDNVSHITRLLQEISVLKIENKELKMELKEHKRDLELIKLNTEDQDTKNTEAIFALIDEVRRAEKEGEKAVSQLIRSANLDRDAANSDLDSVRLRAAKRNDAISSNSQTDESCIDETEESDLIDFTVYPESEISDSNCDEMHATSLQMEKLMERQKEITKQQIATVISQRDEALDKVKRLKKKLVSIKAMEFPTATNQNLQAKLKITEKERDIAVRKLQLLSHDMNEVTLMFNLQKALLPDDVNIHSTSNKESSKLANDMESDKDGLEKPRDKIEMSKPTFNKQLEFLERENLEKGKRIEQLEALVMRQRKKLNTLCAGPLLMDN